MNLNKIKLPASTKKLLGLALGLGVVFVVTLAPLTGAKRVPYFQPLADGLLEKHKNLLLPVSGILLASIAVVIHFYYSEKLSPKRLRISFFATLAVFLVSLGAFMTRPRYVIKPDCASEPIVVGWTRLPGCTICSDVSDAECLVRNVCEISGCWSQDEVFAIELSIYASYLGSLCGFVAMVGIVVLMERARIQARRRTRGRPRKKPESIPPGPPTSEPPVTA